VQVIIGWLTKDLGANRWKHLALHMAESTWQQIYPVRAKYDVFQHTHGKKTHGF
jgi:hypothetical protein